MSPIARLAMVPRDGIFCKDGRDWHTSASGRGHGLEWPWPSTILGALRSAWGRAEEEKIGRPFTAEEWVQKTKPINLVRTLVLRRPMPIEEPWSSDYRVWPVPADALKLEGEQAVHRLDPAPPRLQTLGAYDDEAREALWVPRPIPGQTKPAQLPKWWGDKQFVKWLCGDALNLDGACGSFSLQRRVQAHVRIRPESLTADEGVLFSHDVIETLEPGVEWALGAEVALPNGNSSAFGAHGVASLGADQRLMRLESLKGDVFGVPQALLEKFQVGGVGIRLIVVTPACFERGWLPDGLEEQGLEYRGRLPGIAAEVVLRAAFVPRPVHISGWDMAACRPKPTARMVPPGAVYFFQRSDGQSFRPDETEALWLTAVGSRTDEGFGRVVPGVWQPLRTEG